MKQGIKCGKACLVWLLLVLPWTVEAAGWQAGIARTVITPQQPIWQAGYAARTRASEGTLHELWAKAVALEDEKGNRAVLVTTDLLGIPKAVSDRIRTELQKSLNLSKAQIILNSSHTHSGPVLSNALVDIYPLNAAEQAKIDTYTQQLETQLVQLVQRVVCQPGPGFALGRQRSYALSGKPTKQQRERLCSNSPN